MSEGACLGGEVRFDAGFQKEQRENDAKSEETVPGRSTCGIPDFLCHGGMRTLLKGASSNNPQMPEYVIHGDPATHRQLIFLIGNSPGIINLFSLLLGYINASAIMTGSCFEPCRMQMG